MISPNASPAHAADFVTRLTRTGTAPHVAEELERRIDEIERVEGDDPARARLSALDLAAFVGVAAAAAGIGLAVTLL